MNRLLPIAAVIVLCCCGCVEREMTITSEPTGALVYVSDVEVGRTPVKMPFTWYGDYDIILRADGCQTLKTHANITMPIYEIPPFDLLSEMAPWTYRDSRYLHFRLAELDQPSEDELISRAERLKERNAQPIGK